MVQDITKHLLCVVIRENDAYTPACQGPYTSVRASIILSFP